MPDRISALEDYARRLLAQRDKAEAEVERLRAALEWIADSRPDAEDKVVPWAPKAEDCARAALGEKA